MALVPTPPIEEDSMTFLKPRSLFALGLLGGLLAATGAGAASVAEIVNYQGPDRTDRLVAGAQKEGSILIYTVGTQSDPMLKRFQEKHPYIRVEVWRGDAPEVTRRVLEEYKAQHYVVDSIDLSSAGQQQMRDAGVLQPYWTPEMAAYPAAAIGAQKHWVVDYEGYIGLGYNTKALSPSEAPKSLEDLLDPKWAGRMSISGQPSSLGNWTGAMIRDKGEDFVRKLGKQKITVWQIDGRALSNLVVSGEVPLSPQIYDSHMRNSAMKGAPVAWRALDGVYANVNLLSIAAKAPHPNAAMLYTDFTLSWEGQSMRVEIGNQSARNDLPSPDKPKKIHYLSEEPDFAANFDKWVALAKQVFGAGQKKS
jgi:iron(III) transport system substrate-binding protein